MAKGSVFFAAVALAITGALYATAADAYMGPGSGISAFGSLLSVLAEIVFTVVGFVWYPLKRFLKFCRNKFNDRSA